jgi:hypothetical protein
MSTPSKARPKGKWEEWNDPSAVDEYDRTYTGTVKFTVAFDATHHATLRTVGKSTTAVD